jgi:amino acid transporter
VLCFWSVKCFLNIVTPLTKFVVPATAMLSFVSFWRAAAIVLCDLGSSAYYVGGIAEKAIGKAAPWFILGIMLFSYAVRAVYIESCSMFVRGGVYRVVREALGGTAAKVSVSALLFDYVLTGPISGVSAGLYFAGLINETGRHFHLSFLNVPASVFATAFAVLVTLYFWHTNRVGIPFTSTRALRIMQIAAVMVVLLIAWSVLTIVSRGYQPVPFPRPENLHFSQEALGWLKGTAAPAITFVAILIGLGHSVLAMSGEESLAQVYREIEAPKQRNLIRAGLVIFVFSLIFTSLVSFFAVMIIPDGERSRYFDNLIGGLSMFLIGPFALKFVFHAFVVIVGVLLLSGAVNTSIIGSNGVLNRVAEDGVLPRWLRDPHRKYGTTHRLITTVAAMQIVTILISRGNVYMLGEAYAFGVVWSFAMKALSVVVLRFTRPDAERWRVPFNFHVMGREIPAGLTLITTLLFLMAGINVLTKPVATIAGTAFTIAFFIAFTLSERRYGSKHKGPEPERFQLKVRDNLSTRSLHVRSGNILVAVHDPDNVDHLTRTLEENDPAKTDVVVMSVNVKKEQSDTTRPEQVIDQCETRIFSQVVYAVEKIGKPATLFAVAGKDPYGLIMQASQKLNSSRVILGQSSVMRLNKQKEEVKTAWKRLPAPRPQISIEIVPDKKRAA